MWIIWRGGSLGLYDMMCTCFFQRPLALAQQGRAYDVPRTMYNDHWVLKHPLKTLSTQDLA